MTDQKGKPPKEKPLIKMSKKRMLALKLPCMFCGGQADSNEHVWAEWLQDWVDGDLTGNHGQTFTSFEVIDGAVVFGDPEPHIHGGGALTRKLPITCAGCNNGWMSDLEKSVKDWLGPMAQSAARTELSLDRQLALAFWAEKTAMVWELSQDGGVVATQADRDFVRKQQKPTRTTKVWLARGGSPGWKHHPRHIQGNAATAGSTDGKIAVPSAYGIDLRQSVRARWDILGIGEVMLVVSGATHPGFRAVDSDVIEGTGCLKKFQQIWPSVQEPVIFPRQDLSRVTDDDAERISFLPNFDTELKLNSLQGRLGLGPHDSPWRFASVPQLIPMSYG